MEGRGGIEPPVSRFAGVRINQLCYRPIKLLEIRTGIEPAYADLQSAAWPLRHLIYSISILGHI